MRLDFATWRAGASSLFVRMALILLAGLIAAQLASFWLQWDERATVVAQARGLNFVDRLADAVRLLENDVPRRAQTIEGLAARGLRVTQIDDDAVYANVPRGQIQMSLASRLGAVRELRSAGGGMMHGAMGRAAQNGGAARSFDVRLRDGQWVRITELAEAEPPPALSDEVIVRLLVTLAIVVAVVMLAVRQATRPLQRLAQAADALGRDLDAAPLVDSGPSETRQAAQAFNRMQERIKRLIDERSRALAAVSHDLRTPLTRLRLRTELVADEPLREQMAADLDAMAAMLDATLDYLRGLHDSEAPRLIDIDALVQSIADDCAVLGKTIACEGRAVAPYRGRLSALRRALQNLIDNAIKYGHGARLRVADGADALSLIVEDDGPGIPEAELARVGQPYYRPDASRSRTTGGVGLGLSIANDIAHLHGGRLQLANRPTGGLCATLVLPRSPAVL